MSTMTKTVSSECSSLSDVDYDPITSTFAKLRAVISQEAFLRKELDELFVKRTEDAHIAVQNAQSHLEMVKTQEAYMREILETESAASNEKPEELRIQEEQDAATESARRARELEDAAHITLAYEAARREAEELAEANAKRIGDEEAAEKERQQEAAMVAAVEERRKVEAEELRLEQEKSDRLAKLEAEIRQLEAEEAEMAEQDRREEAQLIAEAAENERIDRDLMEEERWLVEEEEKGEYLHYLSLKEAAVVAEESLSMVQAELDALETQKLVIIQQLESVREQEASCRYMLIRSYLDKSVSSNQPELKSAFISQSLTPERLFGTQPRLSCYLMPTMTKTALSDCSYPESNADNIRDDIGATITRLKAVIDEEASLRKALRALFVKRREEAIDQVRLANLHLDLVNEEETSFCVDLMKAATSANEGSEGFGSRDSIKRVETATPMLSLMTHETTGDHSFSKRLTHNDRDEPLDKAQWTHALGDSGPPISPANSTPEICDNPPMSPAKHAHRFDSPSPPRSTRASANESTGTPGRATDDEDIYSIPSLSSSMIARYTKSPARSTHAVERLPRTPVYSTPRLANDPLLTPPTHYNGVVYSRDTPYHSPTQSARGLEGDYLYPEAAPSQGTPGETHVSPTAWNFGENHGFGIVELKTPALPAAALPTTFAFGSGGFDASPTADTGFGFRVSPTANTNFGFGGRPMPNTGFAFGVGSLPPSTIIEFGAASPEHGEAVSNHHPGEELDLVYEPAAVVGASARFGGLFDGQDHVQAPPARDPSPLPELPEEPVVVVVGKLNPKKFKKKKGGKPNSLTLCDTEPDIQAFLEPPEDIQPLDLNPPEAHVVTVAPGKPKNGKKKKGFLQPKPSDAVIVPFPLEVYLREEEASLAHTQRGLYQYRENVKTLLQLIERFEKPGTVTTGALQKDSGSQVERIEVDAGQPVENNLPTEDDIVILKNRLAKEEGNVRMYLKFAQDEESHIASYRRLIAASSS